MFLRTRGGEDRVSCLWVLEGDSERLLAAPEWLGETGVVPEAERVRRERARERHTGLVAFAADASARVAVFALNGCLWTVGLEGVPRRVRTAGPVTDPRPDPAGSRVAYVTAGALHVVELADGLDRCVAAPESAEVTWGLAEHVGAESMHRNRGYWWSPCGTRLLAARVDTARVQRWWVGDPAEPSRLPRSIAYPAAGTANAEVSLHVLDLDGGSVALDWDRAAFEYVATAGWDAHGPLVSVQSRDQRTVRVLAADPDTGGVTLLDEQRDQAWVELIAGVPARTASGALISTGDSSGTRRLLADGRPVTRRAFRSGRSWP